jgi:hypothetical protein
MKLGCDGLFVVTIDTWCIPLVINSYLNLKTYSITFSNCPDRVVRWKTKRGKVEKGLKCHGWVMDESWGLYWGTWKMGGWGWNITPQTLHILVGYVSGVRAARASKCTPGHPPKLDMFQRVGGRFWGSSFEAHISWHAVSDQPKWTLGRHRYTQHVFCVSLLGDLCRSCVKTHTASKQTTHLWLVSEIMSGWKYM